MVDKEEESGYVNPYLERFILWAWRRFRPEEGWLPVGLLLAAVGCLSGAIIVADWVPEVGVVGWTAVLGLLLGIVLAKRPLPWATAWLFIINYGLIATTIYLAGLRPPVRTLLAGWPAISSHLRLSFALFIDRIAGWWQAVSSGGSSEETIVFAFGLGGLTWLLSAYAGWSAFRQHRPLAGLTVIGLALALNSYYGDVPVWLAAVFVGLAALLAAALNYANLEQEWQHKGVDFSQEIRLDLLLTGGAVALMLLATAFTIPAVNLRAISRAIFERPAMRQAEDTLQRVFAGVEPPRRGPLDEGSGQPGGRGLLPRAYLLGNPPELAEAVAMRATLTFASEAAQVEVPLHWRGISYDYYTGQGWAITNERQERLAAGEPIALPAAEGQLIFQQQIEWLLDERATRYTVGLPLAFNQDVVVLWRGVEDLSRVKGESQVYTATSQLTTAPADTLRTAVVDGVPEAVLARYTQLPETVPDRVIELAQAVAGTAATPYDQALALQSFLRQYPYSLNVELPPADRDPVDYFLFELQRGYCDYYASTMVVMARSLGLPARLAAGFLAQPPDENGVQTIYHINAHSWPEIYFAGYGWVEFEPTPAAGTAALGQFAPPPTPTGLPAASLPTPLPIPQADVRPVGGWWLLLALPLVALLWWLVQRWRNQAGYRGGMDGIRWAYGRLQEQARRLGQHTPASQTPAEFEAALLARLDAAPAHPSRLARWRQRLQEQVRPEAEWLIGVFTARQYGRGGPSNQAARLSWRRMRGRLWLLRILKKIARS